MAPDEEIDVPLDDLADVVEDDGPEDEEERLVFADPGGASALRAASPSNPRDRPCPTCGRTNVLTREDERLGYQCNPCTDAAEGRGW